jgi:hypothetical protein
VVGMNVGPAVGLLVGFIVADKEEGAIVEGLDVGSRVGDLLVGARVDFTVGFTDKLKEGTTDGTNEGPFEGILVEATRRGAGGVMQRILLLET